MIYLCISPLSLKVNFSITTWCLPPHLEIICASDSTCIWTVQCAPYKRLYCHYCYCFIYFVNSLHWGLVIMLLNRVMAQATQLIPGIGVLQKSSCLHYLLPDKWDSGIIHRLVLLRIPSLHPNPRTFPQFVQIWIRRFLVAADDGFETISRRPEIKQYHAQIHVFTRRTSIINATKVIAWHTSLKSSAHPQHLHSAVNADWKASQAT